MRQMTPTLLVVAALGCGLAARADEGEKAKDIRRLLDLAGGGKIGVQVMNQMLENFKKSLPQVPERFWDDFMKEVNPDDLVNLVVPIYARYLDASDIKDLIRLYDTPALRKFVKVQPQIVHDSQEAGQRWGTELAQKLMRRLEEEKKKDQTPAKGK